ncbi:MAG: RsmD family RNA methyltransferase [Treponema sp.]|jgi:16S rRNA (guanine(966)-N(2))-methyltransferase RsmD|nr:RsmD family RNA methyltransferase [Treponema sp.]
MRITGGALAGRRVKVPGGVIRPAMDRMRESVFGVLGDLKGCSFLDLFSGSGIIALEAASRGADPVDAVEIDALKRKTLIENVSISPARIRCHFMAAELYVRRAKKRFDIVFCDPPFPYRFTWDLAASIAVSPLMGPGSRLLVHRPKQEPWVPAGPEGSAAAFPGEILLETSRAYGRSIVDFFRKF